MRTAIVVAGVSILFVCAACGIGLFLLGRGAVQGFQAITQTGEQFLTRTQAGDFQAASQLIAPSARATYSETELRKRWRLLEDAIGKVRSWSVQRYNIHTDTGGTVGTLQMRVQGDKGNGTVDFMLQPEGDRWLITELRFGW
ncbi:MAG: hypothetical protein N2554_09190 [Fimbriimonadales bacterium]|nr:hypothetical protein [Fimbriimonadales bacterium]